MAVKFEKLSESKYFFRCKGICMSPSPDVYKESYGKKCRLKHV